MLLFLPALQEADGKAPQYQMPVDNRESGHGARRYAETLTRARQEQEHHPAFGASSTDTPRLLKKVVRRDRADGGHRWDPAGISAVARSRLVRSPSMSVPRSTLVERD